MVIYSVLFQDQILKINLMKEFYFVEFLIKYHAICKLFLSRFFYNKY